MTSYLILKYSSFLSQVLIYVIDIECKEGRRIFLINYCSSDGATPKQLSDTEK